MKIEKIKFLLILLLLIPLLFPVKTESIDYGITTSVDTEEDLEDLYYGEEIDEETYHALLELLYSPVDINRADANEIYRLPSLTEKDAKNIVKYRKRHNGFGSLNELIQVEGIDREKVDTLQAYADVIPLPEKKRVRIDNVFQADYKWIKETSDDHYEYEEPYQQLRIKDTINKTFYIGVNQSKRWGSKGYSIYEGPPIYNEEGEIEYQEGDIVLDEEESFYEEIKGYFLVEYPQFQMVLGNYQAGFGQGLVFNESSRRYLIGYKGDYESNQDYIKKYLFGGGLRYIHPKFEIAGFYSDIDDKLSYQSGLIEFDTEEEYLEQSSYQKSIPDFIHNELYGGNFMYKFTEDTTVGLTYYHNNVEFAAEGRRPEQYGEALYDTDIYGADFKVQLSEMISLAGEFATIAEEEDADAWVLRLVTDSRTFDMENSVRSYDRNFTNPHSYGFAQWDSSREYSDSDERGLFSNIRYKFGDFIIEGDFDAWKHPSTLATDTEYKLQLTYQMTAITRVKVSREWHDEDVARGMEEMEEVDQRTSDARTTTIFQIDNKGDKIEMSLKYRLKQYVESSSPEYKKNNYYKIKITYRPTDNAKLITDLKFNDDNLYRKQDNSSYEEYVEYGFRWEHKIFRNHLKYTLAYKTRDYLEDSGLRNPEKLPEETYRGYLTLKF